jgi:hypothetical protein
MKISTLLLVVQFFIAVNCSAQGQYKVLDSLESSFEHIKRDMNVPCQFQVTFNRRENGKPFFITNDSTQLEFDFFKITSLPFFDSTQTNFETTSSYYEWLLQRKNSLKSISFSKIRENKDDGYFVYKIHDASGTFYRLVAREGNILFGIKIFDNKISAEEQLNKLQLLYALNKN